MMFRRFANLLCSAVCFFIPIKMSSACTCGQIGRDSSVKLHKLALQENVNINIISMHAETFTLVIVLRNSFPGILLGSHQVADSKRLDRLVE